MLLIFQDFIKLKHTYTFSITSLTNKSLLLSQTGPLDESDLKILSQQDCSSEGIASLEIRSSSLPVFALIAYFALFFQPVECVQRK